MNAIGGYFELELRTGDEYHRHAVRLNTGRNALEFVLRSRRYSRLYIPYYTCDVLLEPLKKLSIAWSFYSVDEDLEPLFDFAQVADDEGFLYTNYFGVKGGVVERLSTRCRNLIVDNSQAFFSRPIALRDTFYSCRKFFGVPDGAYLYMEGADTSALPRDVSVDRFMHLIKRIDCGAESGYDDFKANDNALIGQPIKEMSNLTRSLMCSLDYKAAKARRQANVKVLHDSLGSLNELHVSIDDESVPMAYPFLSTTPDLKHKLIEHKIYVPTYWPNVLQWVNGDQWEFRLARNLVPIPVDHRYDTSELSRVIDLVKHAG
jgi:hypothetical protein